MDLFKIHLKNYLFSVLKRAIFAKERCSAFNFTQNADIITRNSSTNANNSQNTAQQHPTKPEKEVELQKVNKTETTITSKPIEILKPATKTHIEEMFRIENTQNHTLLTSTPNYVLNISFGGSTTKNHTSTPAPKDLKPVRTVLGPSFDAFATMGSCRYSAFYDTRYAKGSLSHEFLVDKPTECFQV